MHSSVRRTAATLPSGNEISYKYLANAEALKARLWARLQECSARVAAGAKGTSRRV